jgi:hypothetical protein
LTKYVSPAAVYDITPCDENVAVAAARNFDVAPIRKFELKQLAGPGSLGFDESEDNRDY